MFRHIALFRWSDEITTDAVARLTDALRACAKAVPEVRGYACGPDVVAAAGGGPSDDRFDYAVVADFDDEAGWRVYDGSEEHARVRAELIRPFLAARIVAQLEI